MTHSAARPDDATDDLFLGAVGSRVRSARESRGLSRRALSGRARVSERYLAQIESGAGNISISLLKRVADALDCDIAALISPPDPLSRRLQAAGPKERAAVQALLGTPDDYGGRVALVGLRGAGKSTLGARAADQLGLPFRELNDEIAASAGLSVTEVFALYGQEGYRKLEREALDRLAYGLPVVLAVSGGLVCEPETFVLLLKRFHTIWLKARPEDHMARVRAQGDERPMAGNPTAMQDLRSILTDREMLYARANQVVDTTAQSPGESLRTLLAAMRRITPARS